MIKAQLLGDKIYSKSTDAFSLYGRSRFGEKKQNRIEYSMYEALFLLEKNKMDICQGEKLISFEELLKKTKRKNKTPKTK